MRNSYILQKFLLIMSLRKIVFLIGIGLSALATWFLFLSYVMLTSGTLLVITGAFLLVYYVITGTAGVILTIAGVPPAEWLKYVPMIIGVIQLILIVLIVIAAKTISLGLLVLLIPLIFLGARELIYKILQSSTKDGVEFSYFRKL